VRLTISSGAASGQSWAIGGGSMIVGRDPGADVSINDPRVSWRHARVTPLPDGRVILEDLNSTNGTRVNGQDVHDRAFLNGGEQISVGGVMAVYSAEREAAPIGAGTAAGANAFPPPNPEAGGAFAPFPEPAIRQQSPSVIQRVMLQRSVRRANVLAAVAVVVSLSLIVFVAAVALQPSRPAATGAPARPTLSVADIAAAAEPSTVLVVALQNGERYASGTGWVLDAQGGLIVTNQHVVNDGETFQVGMASMLAADVVAAAPCQDLTVLRVQGSASGLRTLPLGDQSTLRLADTVIALGYPVNASPTDDLQVTVGTVSVVHTSYEGGTDGPDYSNVIQSTATINPGNSGGPLIDLNGNLVGVNTATVRGTVVEGLNYAIGVDRVKQVVPALQQGDSTYWTGLGFDAYITQASLQSDAQILQRLGLPVTPGLIIGHLAQGTTPPGFNLPALLVGVDGTPMDGSLQGYCNAVGASTGSTADMSVFTAGSPHPTDVEVPFR
jgi:S1-C subfamily serine protease